MKRMIFSGILVVAAGCGALMAQAPARRARARGRPQG